MHYQHIKVPELGAKLHIAQDGTLQVPDNPIICYIDGDGVGPDILPLMRRVVDEAVLRCYGERRQIHWLELYQGEKAARLYDGEWVPEETLDALRDFHVAVKGPVTTPLGGGFRSLNIALRQEMDLYANIRPMAGIQGLPSPMSNAASLDITLFRDCSEDIYSGIEWQADSPDARQLIEFMQGELGVTRLRFSDDCGLALKNISREGSTRLVRRALEFALERGRDSVTLVHQGNTLKCTEGAFKQWGFALAREEFGAKDHENGRWLSIPRPGMADLLIKDCLTDQAIQQLILYPERFDVIATTNRNGDLLADMVCAQVGGLGIFPAINLNEQIAIFEPTHGTFSRIAGQNCANPSSILFAAVAMLGHLGWHESAECIERALKLTIAANSTFFALSRHNALGAGLGSDEFARQVCRAMGDQA